MMWRGGGGAGGKGDFILRRPNQWEQVSLRHRVGPEPELDLPLFNIMAVQDGNLEQ